MLSNAQISRLEDEQRLAEEAQHLLNSPVFTTVMDKIRNDLDNLLLTMDTTDTEICADIIRRKQVFESICKSINEYINTGKLATRTLMDDKKIKPFKR